MQIYVIRDKTTHKTWGGPYISVHGAKQSFNRYGEWKTVDGRMRNVKGDFDKGEHNYEIALVYEAD